MARKKRVDELSRPERRGVPGPMPLLVIAGLPEATALAAAATLSNDPQSRWHAVAAPFGSGDERIYDAEAAIRRLAARACGFALKGTPTAEGVPMPSRLAIAYVSQDGSEALWRVFGHAAWPLPLVHPDWTWPKGRHWRHDIETVNALLRRAVATIEVAPARDIQLRLEARRGEDPLLLPGRNFHLAGGARLVERFRGFMAGRLTVAEVEEGIEVRRFAFEKLRRFYEHVGGKNKKFAVDERELVFAKSHHGQHGGRHRILAEGEELAPAVVQRILESRFRFGTPLEPEGFQHDAQYEGKRLLDNMPFDCTARGSIEVSGTHANVYPSDVVS